MQPGVISAVPEAKTCSVRIAETMWLGRLAGCVALVPALVQIVLLVFQPLPFLVLSRCLYLNELIESLPQATDRSNRGFGHKVPTTRW